LAPLLFGPRSGRSHSETWAGCIVSLTTPISSSLRAPKSVSSRNRSEKSSNIPEVGDAPSAGREDGGVGARGFAGQLHSVGSVRAHLEDVAVGDVWVKEIFLPEGNQAGEEAQPVRPTRVPPRMARRRSPRLPELSRPSRRTPSRCVWRRRCGRNRTPWRKPARQ
jgi:hypothetical protein